jgi:hypothetical protein
MLFGSVGNPALKQFLCHNKSHSHAFPVAKFFNNFCWIAVPSVDGFIHGAHVAGGDFADEGIEAPEAPNHNQGAPCPSPLRTWD